MISAALSVSLPAPFAYTSRGKLLDLDMQMAVLKCLFYLKKTKTKTNDCYICRNNATWCCYDDIWGDYEETATQSKENQLSSLEEYWAVGRTEEDAAFVCTCFWYAFSLFH